METVDESSSVEIPRKRKSRSHDSDSDLALDESINANDDNDKERPCNLLAFWILGLCNNYAYVIMLSAAFDILEKKDPNSAHNQTAHIIIPSGPTVPSYNLTNATIVDPYECTQISTGAILLADILPTLVIKLTAPWFLDRVPYDIRVALAVIGEVFCFIIVALSNSLSFSLFGVVLASATGGLGEFTFISMSSFYNKNVVSTYSSGTGAAGFIGSLSYAGLIAAGLSPRNTLLVMLFVPLLEAFSFWGILERKVPLPSIISNRMRGRDDSIYEEPLLAPEPVKLSVTLTYPEKVKAIKPLLIYIIPLILVYYAEYVINQGLFELVYFPGIWLSHDEQYRWFQVTYQLSVFISRSSVNLIQIKHIWIFAVLQYVNLAILLAESALHFLPNIWCMFAIVFFEGLLGGAAFVNTFYSISQETADREKEFSMGATTIADSTGISLAGISAIPIHNAMCKI